MDGVLETDSAVAVTRAVLPSKVVERDRFVTTETLDPAPLKCLERAEQDRPDDRRDSGDRVGNRIPL
jgi:hypothetical protein